MYVVEVGSELELLAYGWLGDTEGVGDLALAHTNGHHCPQGKHAPQPCEILVNPGVGLGASRGPRWPSRSTSPPGTAVLLVGAPLAFVRQVLVIAGVVLALPSTKYGLMVSAGDLTQLLAATTLAGAIGAILGAGLGSVTRNIGGAVTTAVLVVFVIPLLAAQLVTHAGSWIPPTLSGVISGSAATSASGLL